MGYQESYVRMKNSKDFDKLVEAFRNIGNQFYIDNGARPVRIVTLKKPIEGTLEHMCMSGKIYSFEAGEKFVYVSGERCIQRNAYFMLNGRREDIDIDDVEIYFTECFPSEDIFANNGVNDMAAHEDFKW